MTPVRTGRAVLSLLLLLAPGLGAHAAGPTARLPLAAEGSPGALGFETSGPPAAVLTGLLLPSSGPLTSWAPVYSALGADGSLTEVQTGGWTGPVPRAWVKAVKPGYVVGGFRVLVRTAPEPVQTRQIQVFWRPWTNGQAGETAVTSRVYGSPAGPQDTIRIVELTLPAGAVPTGLWGQVSSGTVSQVSLVVRLPEAAPVRAPTLLEALKAPAAAPEASGPPARGPKTPTVPEVKLLRP